MQAYKINSKVIIHYGVKGMKWGVRRTKNELKYDVGSIESVLRQRFKHAKVSYKISEHALDRIKNKNDRRVSADDIINAISEPLHKSNIKIDDYGRKSVQYIGVKATVAVNPDAGMICSVWKTGSKRRQKYQKEQQNV